MPPVPPASRVVVPAVLQAPEHVSRVYSSLDFVTVTLDSSGKGSVRADIPLEQISPPLALATLEGLSTRVSLPPNETGTQALKLVQANGRTFVRVEIHGANVSQLESAPLALALGEALSLGKASVPTLMVQVSTRRLELDRTAPALRMLLDDRANDAKRLEFLKQNLVDLRTGTGSWFGTHQLEAEQVALQARVVETAAALDAQRSALEPQFSGFDALSKLKCAPEDLAMERGAWTKTMAEGRDAAVALPAARENRKTAVEAGVPEAVAEDDATIAHLESLVLAGQTAEARVNERYATARRESPSSADQWLAQFSSLHAPPDLSGFRRALVEAQSARDALEMNHGDLERVKTNSRAVLPGQLLKAEQAVTDAANTLAASDARIEGFRDGSKKEVVSVATGYPADLKIL